MAFAWCSDCKTLHADGAHTRPQPLPPEAALKHLQAVHNDLRRAADVAERRLRQLCDPQSVEEDPATAAGTRAAAWRAADDLRVELDKR